MVYAIGSSTGAFCPRRPHLGIGEGVRVGTGGPSCALIVLSDLPISPYVFHSKVLSGIPELKVKMKI